MLEEFWAHFAVPSFFRCAWQFFLQHLCTVAEFSVFIQILPWEQVLALSEAKLPHLRNTRIGLDAD